MITGTILILIIILFFGWVYFSTYHPARVQDESISCKKNMPRLKPGQTIKILSWNVQYMAGKDYVFFYDLLDGSGPDDRPSSKSIAETLDEVARIIQEENPDLVLLQEMDLGADRTDRMDQTAELQKRLAKPYGCITRAYYWKADFVPHPRILGSAGMQLVTLSRFEISESLRHQLALIPANVIYQQFNIKRAALETRLPVEGASPFVAINTHLDAFAQGSDTMQKQVQQLKEILDEKDRMNTPWVIGGDFNLLPPGQYSLLGPSQQKYFQEKTELAPFFEKYNPFPGKDQVMGPEKEKYFTHYPNDPLAKGPDRTIDYIFSSKTVPRTDARVLHGSTHRISDHLPLVVTLKIPGPGG